MNFNQAANFRDGLHCVGRQVEEHLKNVVKVAEEHRVVGECALLQDRHVVVFQLVLQRILHFADLLTRRELDLSGLKAVEVKEGPVEHVSDAGVEDLGLVHDKGVRHLELLNLAVEAGLEHALGEELDVLDRVNHVFHDGAGEHPHHARVLKLVL